MKFCLNIKLFQDPDFKIQVGSTIFPYIIDTSNGEKFEYSYELSTDKYQYTEGEIITINIKTIIAKDITETNSNKSLGILLMKSLSHEILKTFKTLL